MVRDGIVKNNTLLFDARGTPAFSGQAKETREGLKSGHIPGACNKWYKDLITET